MNARLSFLSRWWQSKGFGIESRTDFDYLHDVLRERLPFYAYAELEQMYPQATRDEHRLAQLLFRISNAEQPSHTRLLGLPSAINATALEKVASRRSGGELVFGEGEVTLPHFHGISVLVLTHIDTLNDELWQRVLQTSNAITYDMQTVGVALFRRERYAEHYYIQKP